MMRTRGCGEGAVVGLVHEQRVDRLLQHGVARDVHDGPLAEERGVQVGEPLLVRAAQPPLEGGDLRQVGKDQVRTLLQRLAQRPDVDTLRQRVDVRQLGCVLAVNESDGDPAHLSDGRGLHLLARHGCAVGGPEGRFLQRAQRGVLVLLVPRRRNADFGEAPEGTLAEELQLGRPVGRQQPPQGLEVADQGGGLFGGYHSGWWVVGSRLSGALAVGEKLPNGLPPSPLPPASRIPSPPSPGRALCRRCGRCGPP